jgi:hypothetical protein
MTMRYLHASTTSHQSISILLPIRDLSRRLQSLAILPYQRTSSDNLDCVLVYNSGSCRRLRWLPWGRSVVGLCRMIVSGLSLRLPRISGVVVWASVQVSLSARSLHRGGEGVMWVNSRVSVSCLLVSVYVSHRGGHLDFLPELQKKGFTGISLAGKFRKINKSSCVSIICSWTGRECL